MEYNKLEILAKERNVSFYRISKDTGISTVTFTHWKSGKYKPKIDKLILIARYFNVPVEYFLGD